MSPYRARTSALASWLMIFAALPMASWSGNDSGLSWRATRLRLNRLGVIAFVLIALLAALPANAALVASTESGSVRGTETDSMFVFRGIPYAKPPVGKLRWRPPQPAEPWRGVREATRFAGHCAQPLSTVGRGTLNEDCLYLNVYVPKPMNENEQLPVMVWFHGGALFLGESDDYDPTRLVAQGVVVVTINYRLGLLGFLVHPALSAESSYGGSGNYGIMDQQAALSWVKRNIGQFGGDSHNVTIIGESAGGLSVHTHLASARSAGLFHRAVIQSGAYALVQPTLVVSEAAGVYLATAAGCFFQTATCLRALPVANLLVAGGVTGFMPNLDNNVLTQTVLDALTSGNFNQVPLLEGSNHDELLLFIDLSDALFACTSRASARLASRFVPTFVYEFNDPNAPQPFPLSLGLPIGAYHESEIQYLLNLPAYPPPRFTPEQQALADAMIEYWTNFAKHGDPNGDGDPAWPAYTIANDTILSLKPAATLPTRRFAVDHNCNLWAPTP